MTFLYFFARFARLFTGIKILYRWPKEEKMILDDLDDRLSNMILNDLDDR